ncbi:MAG TPA: hypothetical protein PL071_10390 [Nitrosomonas sp.]|jgi:hypothetical protein|nr:hypothetical protein [Nitrosomonas sp.]
MPYKSDAQRRLFHHLLSKGKIKKETVEEFDKASKGKNLVEHLAYGGIAGDVYEDGAAHDDHALDTTGYAHGGIVKEKKEDVKPKLAKALMKARMFK